MKYTVLILAVVLSACGMTESEQGDPFKQAIGQIPPAQSNAPAPTDPFAPVLKKNGG